MTSRLGFGKRLGSPERIREHRHCPLDFIGKYPDRPGYASHPICVGKPRRLIAYLGPISIPPTDDPVVLEFWGRAQTESPSIPPSPVVGLPCSATLFQVQRFQLAWQHV